MFWNLSKFDEEYKNSARSQKKEGNKKFPITDQFKFCQLFLKILEIIIRKISDFPKQTQQEWLRIASGRRNVLIQQHKPLLKTSRQH
jgi:hypothetical protein